MNTIITCPHCAAQIECGAKPPKFCSHCGGSLATVSPDAPTGTFNPEAVTVPPTVDLEAPTLPPSTSGYAGSAATPSSVGGYKLLRTLGGGGMGTVYEAEEAATGRHVALKLVLPQYATAGDALERFRQEGQLASTLSHPRCVFVLAADEDQGRPYIVMELMPGQTLQDYVKEHGPLSVEEAVRKALDVMEGLHEAHQRGMVHRDVKPSNCFIEANGRVKIGDFGLAKSLVRESHLTRTGAFLGTPLYASPEQVKGQPVDAQSDLYSVAATLYFLLTGQAPFQSGDAMAALARIVSDDPPPLKSLRPELPRGLDKVVLRALSRDRQRRYRDLEELRRALVPFLPAQPSISGQGLRFGAYVLDQLIYNFAFSGFIILLHRLLANAETPWVLFSLIHATRISTFIAYFGIMEGWRGWSPGKRLLRLRVSGMKDSSPPGIWRGMARAAIFNAIFIPAALLPDLLKQIYAPQVGDFQVTNIPDDLTIPLAVIGWLQIFLFGAGIVAVILPMRPRNGYRGLHEVLSGTRVLALRWPQLRKRHVLDVPEAAPPPPRDSTIPERIANYDVLGLVHEDGAGRTLLAEDRGLQRPVWLWLRPNSGPAFDQRLTAVSRQGRLRWIGRGSAGEQQWDAFLAPSGISLREYLRQRGALAWADARPVLEDLLDELTASCQDGTLPDRLSVDQVWLLPKGHVALMPYPLLGTTTEELTLERSAAEPSDGADDQRFSLSYLHHVMATCLKGSAIRRDDTADLLYAPVPAYAESILHRLFGHQEPPYQALDELRQELEATQSRANHVTRLRRGLHFLFMGLLGMFPFMGTLVVPIAFIVSLAEIYRGRERLDPEALVFLALPLLGWILWPAATRGGYAYWRGGLRLRRADGRKAARWQVLLRSALLWVPVGILLFGSLYAGSTFPHARWLYFGLAGLAVIFLAFHVGYAIWSPRQGWHDKIAGTYLVPE